MYQDFYELKQLPFQLLPDPDFFFHSHKHDNALTHLDYGISQRAGFIVITGEIGTGKTTKQPSNVRAGNVELFEPVQGNE